MVRSVVAGLIGLLAPAAAFQTLPIPIGQLRKQVTDRSRMSIQAADYPEYNLSVPIDHFHNETRYEPHSDGTFNLRYYFDSQFYEPGGPVFVLSGGETSVEDRIPYLEKGIVYEIAKATKGLGVILEHRYYGSSVPTPDFSTENLRFLTTEQALADTAYFAKNVKFEGLEDVDFSPENTPWIAYGGSYAGSFVAFLRVVYPEVFFGAISSSGVPQAIWDYWQYFEAARLFAPGDCSNITGKVTHVVDSILLDEANADYIPQLKEVFGLSDVSDNKDFASAIASGIYELQSYNWDPEISGDGFFTYCETVQKDTNQYPNLESKRDSVKELITAAGYEDELDTLVEHFLNYIGSLGRTLAACDGDQNECFGTSDAHFLAEDDLSQTWRLWPYQVCTEWGFLQTGSGAPDDILPMISRAVDLEYSSRQCREAFNLDGEADTDIINKYGGHDIAYDRLAFVDGQWDPWRAAGVQAVGLPPRESTTSQPVILIDKAVHHWDENGVTEDQVTPDFPPAAVKEAKDEIREFVLEWLKEWKA